MASGYETPAALATVSMVSLPRCASCTPIITRPLAESWLSIATFSGSALRHGPHQVAQKSITTTLPARAANTSPFLSGAISLSRPTQPRTVKAGGALPVIDLCATPASPIRQNQSSGNSSAARAVGAVVTPAARACGASANDDSAARTAAIGAYMVWQGTFDRGGHGGEHCVPGDSCQVALR